MLTPSPTFKLGRNRPAPSPHEQGRVQLSDLLSPLPKPPPQVLYGPKASQALSTMLGNDVAGDCVEAGMLHAVGVWEANAGTPATFTAAQALNVYSAITGYNRNNPNSDQGTDEITAFKYWRDTGIPAPSNQHKILGWASVDGSNILEVQIAQWLFEVLGFGVELPDEWINPFPSRDNFVFDVAGPSNPNNGHFFIGHGFTKLGVRIATWGFRGLITWPAINKYATNSGGVGSGELYALFSQDALNLATKRAPNNYDLTQLETYLASL